MPSLPDTLVECLGKAMRQCDTAGAVQVSMTHSEVHRTPNPFGHGEGEEKECDGLARMLLAYQKQGVVCKEGEEGWMLVAAAIVHEYLVKGKLVVYLEKVDTTGRWAQGGLPYQGSSAASALISGYLEWLRAREIPMYMYVFARPQPQYIFANSAAFVGKRTLDDVALVKWWQRALTPLLSVGRAKGYMCVPGDEMRMTNGWMKGVCGIEEGAKAVETIPRFPDDPMERLIRTEAAKDLTVAQFVDFLSMAEECGGGKRAGVFTIVTEGPCKADLYVEESLQKDAKAQWKRINKALLLEGEFGTRGEAEHSSASVHALLRGHSTSVTIPGGSFDNAAWVERKKRALDASTKALPAVTTLQPRKRTKV